jgi:HSP20 family protein
MKDTQSKAGKRENRKVATTVPTRKTESILDELRQMDERITKRAFEIFDGNGHIDGKDLDDWLRAERELTWKPAIDLKEQEDKFLLQVAMPGVESKDINIQVTPEEILIKADVHHEHKEDKGKVHTCEFASGSLFRSVHLPRTIDPDKVHAEFKDGMLSLTADVAKESLPKKIEVNVKAAAN